MAQKGFYLANDGGVALEVTVRDFQLNTETLVGGSVQRIEPGDNGFVPIHIKGETSINRWDLDSALEKAAHEQGGFLNSVATEEVQYRVPIAVTYRDYSNNRYISRAEMRFMYELLQPNRIEFTAPQQERFTPVVSS